jgi:hypothetical protein
VYYLFTAAAEEDETNPCIRISHNLKMISYLTSYFTPSPARAPAPEQEKGEEEEEAVLVELEEEGLSLPPPHTMDPEEVNGNGLPRETHTPLQHSHEAMVKIRYLLEEYDDIHATHSMPGLPLSGYCKHQLVDCWCLLYDQGICKRDKAKARSSGGKGPRAGGPKESGTKTRVLKKESDGKQAKE